MNRTAIPLEYYIPVPIEAEAGRCPVCGNYMDETGCHAIDKTTRIRKGRAALAISCYVGNPDLPDEGPVL